MNILLSKDPQTPRRDRKFERHASDELAASPSEPAQKVAKLGRLAQPKSGVAKRALPESPACLAAEETCQPSVGDVALLTKLFTAMEAVMVLLDCRKTRPTVAAVQKDTANLCGRELSTPRLRAILALARDMLDVTWVGSGSSAAMEVRQLTDDGKRRQPSWLEQNERRARFRQAAEAAGSTVGTVLAVLPSPTTSAAARFEAPAAAPAPAAASAPPSPERPLRRQFSAVVARTEDKPKGASDRLQALRSRVQARESEAKVEAVKQMASDELDAEIIRCEDAIALQAIIATLFARGAGTSAGAQKEGLHRRGASASSAEVLGAAGSLSFSRQVLRPMSLEAASAALNWLAPRATSWFHVVAAEHSRRAGSFLHPQEDGSSSAVQAQLQAELRSLRSQLQRRAAAVGAPPLPEEPTAAPAAAATAAAAPAGRKRRLSGKTVDPTWEQ